MKESFKNVLCFAAIFIVLMLCSAMSLRLITDAQLCDFGMNEYKAALVPWLIIYFCLCSTIIIISFIIQMLVAGKFTNKSIELVCEHLKELNKRELACRKTAMDSIAGTPIDWDAINERSVQWDKDDEEYEKQYKELQNEYKYFAYFWDNDCED